MEFIVSMAEMPVEIISSGYSYTWGPSVPVPTLTDSSVRRQTYTRVGVDGRSVDVEVVLGQDLGALVDGTSGSIEDTTKHVLGHANFQALAGELDLGL
jgi:hypothetical protein